MANQFKTAEHMALFTSSFVSLLAGQVEANAYALKSGPVSTRGAIEPRDMGASAV